MASRDEAERGLVTCEVSEQHGATIIRPEGQLDIGTYGHLRDVLLKCAADQPRALIVDLAALTITQEFLVSVFVTVWMRTEQWSPVPLVIVPGPTNSAQFQHGPARRFLTIRPTVRDAVERLAEPQQHHRTVLWLPSSPLCLHVVAEFVAETCGNWQVDELMEDAVAVAAELVGNAVRHTASPARLRLELWPGRLTVAVTDEDPRPVRWPHRDAQPDPADSGLKLIVRRARAWGCSRAWSGGKVVWAVLSRPAVR
ncbi:STAS domain-containing protein [Kutzneria sp. CA-103260]|uniref:STAS domain-containing protein n=1 Tax=Kutzneria sp. CA-103260 TaxID=2802641 RepID=UPI001BAB8A2B|nr:STAS domain-containing protein [Kutzneria sp. CA-103260]QUQ67185.1 anti-anti-sigma factor [Kutzneria sp. CA-103260]